MRPVHLAVLSLPFIAGCLGEAVPVQEKVSLREARVGFKPKLMPGCAAVPGAGAAAGDLPQDLV